MSLLVQPSSTQFTNTHYSPPKKFWKKIRHEKNKIVTEKFYKKNQKKKFNKKRTTQTRNIHKTLLTKNIRWRVILGNSTQFTNTIKSLNLHNYVKKHFLNFRFLVVAFSSPTGYNYDSNSNHYEIAEATIQLSSATLSLRVEMIHQE